MGRNALTVIGLSILILSQLGFDIPEIINFRLPINSTVEFKIINAPYSGAFTNSYISLIYYLFSTLDFAPSFKTFASDGTDDNKFPFSSAYQRLNAVS